MRGFIFALSLAIGIPAFAQDAGFSKTPAITGYMDLQMQWGRGTIDLDSGLGKGLAGDPTGFSVYQGAIILSNEFEKSEWVLDLPFRQSSTLETLTAGGATTTGASNSFDLAVKDAQAYVKYQTERGIFWQLGQFDSSFGLEGNDTVDLIFPQFGILQPFTPNTHTGLQLGYSFLPFYVSMIVGNGDSRGIQSSDHGPQLGLRFGWNEGPYQFSLGALYQDNKGSYLLSGGELAEYDPSILVNGVLTATLSRIEFGFELDVAQSRYKEAQTLGGRRSHEPVYALLGQVSYALNGTVVAGLRAETMRNDDGNIFVRYADSASAAVGSQTGQGGRYSKIAFALRHIVNEDLSAKAGVEFVELKVGDDAPSASQTQNWVQGSAGAVYSF